MYIIKCYKPAFWFVLGGILLGVLPIQLGQAAPGVVAQKPLFVEANAIPNIMVLLDNSGSMSNLVPDFPYSSEESTWNNCPQSMRLDPGVFQTLDVRITSAGLAYIQAYYTLGSSTDYDWKNSSGIGQTGRNSVCFDPELKYKARLYANGGGVGATKYPSGYLDAQYTGHYLNWYFGASSRDWGIDSRRRPGVKQRMEIAKEGSTILVDSLNSVRFGVATYSDNTSTTASTFQQAQLLIPMTDIGDAGGSIRTNIKAQIAQLTPSGMTPLSESLASLGRYFATNGSGNVGQLTIHPGQSNHSTVTGTNLFTHAPTGAPTAGPVTAFCQQNFVLLVTDGRPQADQALVNNAYLKDYDGDCQPPASCLTYDRKIGQEYETYGSDYLDDVAKALFEIDLRPDLNDGDGHAVVNNVLTYPIGFADDQAIEDPLLQHTADNGQGVGPGEGVYLTASTAMQLQSAFQEASRHIMAQTGTMASVTFNASQLETNSVLYQATFDTVNWSGHLTATPIQQDGSLLTDASGALDNQWDAATVLDNRDLAATPRVLLTYNGVDGIPLTWSQLTATQQNDLKQDGLGGSEASPYTKAQARLNWLRGDRTQEGVGLKLRYRNSRLGDIVNSSPIYVGQAEMGFSNSSLFPIGYSSYKAATANRVPMVYVGANDGLLHGFRASDGQELLAYMPGNLFDQMLTQGMHYLTQSSYNHRYYVDLTPTVSDAYVATSVGGTQGWHTILVGGERGGGRGIFALDITDPSLFSEQGSSPANTVLWEFTSAHNADLGYSFSEATVVMTNSKVNGINRWAVIFGNGYNDSGDGSADLFVLFLEGGLDGSWSLGNDYIKITTATGTTSERNGLSTPVAADLDGNGTVDRVYAGDLFGNVWAFNLADASHGNWNVAYFNGTKPLPLFVDSYQIGTGSSRTTVLQPITAKPVLMRHPTEASTTANYPNVMVFVGSGQYITQQDPAMTQTQSFYGVWDNGTSGVTRSNLTAQMVTIDPLNSGLRLITNNAVNYHSKMGCYIDLPEAGERVVVDAKIRGGVVYFNSLIPSVTQCTYGGSGWLMSMDPSTCGQTPQAAFDANHDQTVDADDLVSSAPGETPKPPAGERFNQGLPAESAFLGDNQYTPGSSGEIVQRKIKTGSNARLGRLSWRELRSSE
ncbi:MAG: PilC/PilY family type IV pilus protein [Magnetococcus sp. DMHC-6]